MSYEFIIFDEQNHDGLPFAYWPLIEANGTVAADVMGANNGAYAGSPTLNTQPGPLSRESGGWPTFNGSSQYVNVGTLGTLGANLANGLTIECWIRSSTTNAIMSAFGILGASLQPFVMIALNQDNTGSTAAGYIRVQCNDFTTVSLSGYVLSNTGITNGLAHHLVVTILPGSNAIAVYIDGVSKTVSYAQQNTPHTWGNFPCAPCLGCRNYNGTFQQHFSGQMAHAALYNYVLAADRVNAHYLAGLNGTPDKRLLMER